MMLRPFFSFYGCKWRDAPHYPAPIYDRIFEPFAGGAGYSTRHYQKSVVLIECDPEIAELWRWLISASQDDVLALPLEVPSTVDALSLPPGPAALIGFWLNHGTNAPRQSPSAWMRSGTRNDSFWGEVVRGRVSSQVGAIKHWSILEGDFTDAEDEEATWFLDPPYANLAGSRYRCKFTRHRELGAWAVQRRGQVIACENVGATWLPFQPWRTVKANESRTGGKKSEEAIWFGGPQPPTQGSLFT